MPGSPNEILGQKAIYRPRSQLQPADPLVLTGVAAGKRVFTQQDGGYAVDIVIDNLDTVNQLKFQFNSFDGSTNVITLAANSVFNASDQKIVSINVLAGSTSWQVVYSIVRGPKFE